jgi:hypothetical protein
MTRNIIFIDKTSLGRAKLQAHVNTTVVQQILNKESAPVSRSVG